MPKKGPIRIKVQHRREPDVRRLGRALIALAQAQAEADAAAEHKRQQKRTPPEAQP